MVTQAQIDSNETINISVSVTGKLKNYTDTSKITQWRNHLRKDPSGSDDQYKAFTYTSGLGLSQMSQKTFTIKAGVLKSADSYTQKFAVASYVTVNGQVLQSSTEYCSVTLYKGIPPPPPVTNLPPVADISAPATVKAGDEITIFGTGSYDPDGSIVRYIWNVKGADKNLPEEPYGDVVYSKEGQYTILLVVVDDKGASGYILFF
jgi:Na+-transporting NADH:ubiquinone oxidoreductase subunit NqrF